MNRPAYNEFGERTDRFRVVLFAYCGMRQTIAECEDYADARREAAAAIREARASGQHVDTLVRHQEWELCEPDDCALVPDNAGTLAIRYPSHTCDEDCDDGM